MGKHTTSSKRALAVLTACTTLGFSGIMPLGIAGADPAPKAGDPCVPVRIISADGTWSKGDKKYLQEVIAKAKEAASGNIDSSTIEVEMRDPKTITPENPEKPDDTWMNALTNNGVSAVVKFGAYQGDREKYNDPAAQTVEPGTDALVGAVYTISVAKMADGGVRSLIDDGWIPKTDAALQAAVRSSPEAHVFRNLVKFAPVGRVGTKLYFKNETDRAGFRSFNTDNAEMTKQVLGLSEVEFPEETIGSPEDWENLAGDGKVDGKTFMNAVRQKAEEGTLEEIDNYRSGPIGPATDKARAASTQTRDTPPEVILPGDPVAPELPVVPEVFVAETTKPGEPTVTPNSESGKNDTPAADAPANDKPAPKPGNGNDEELDGVPGGSGGNAGDSGDDEPTVTTNADAPETTKSSPSSVSSDGTSTSSPSDTTSSSKSTSKSSSSDSSDSSSNSTDSDTEEKPDPKYTPANTKVTGDKKYDKDKDELKKKLAAQMQMVSNECPSTKFILLGAREGAGAIGDLAADIGNGNGPVAPEKVIAVGLLSDPERNPMSGLEDTVADINKLCVLESELPEDGATSTTPAVVNKGGNNDDTLDGSVAGEPTTTTAAATPAKDEPKRTLGQPCADVGQRGGPMSGGQLIGETVDGSGIYGQRTMGFGALAGRTATICLKSDAKCASSRENTLIPLLARALSGDQKASPAAMQAAMQSATGLMKLLAAIDFGQITSMSSDVQKVATNAPILGGAVGSLLVAPNPASAAIALNAAAPTAQGILGIGGGVLKISSQLVQVYESTPELPQIVDFINLINPDTKTGKDLLARIPGGNSPQTVGALRAVVPVLNALNSIPKAQVLSLGGDISKTLGKSLTNPAELVTLLSQSVSMFTTLAGAAGGLQGSPNALTQTASLVNPYPMSDKDSATPAVDYSTAEVNRGGTTATDWMGSWLGSQSQKAVRQVGTSGVSGDATFGGGNRPNYSGTPASDKRSKPTISGALNTTPPTSTFSAEPASTPTDENATSPKQKYLVGARPTFYANVNKMAGTQKTGALHELAQTPVAEWVGEGDAPERLNRVLKQGREQNSTPVVVLYNIPNRDLGSHSGGGAANGAAYKKWIDDVSNRIGDGNIVLIVEPDAVPHMDGRPAAEVSERSELLAYALNKLKANKNASVYLDAGHASWPSDPAKAARLLKLVADKGAAIPGISLNVSNFHPAQETVSHGKAIIKAFGKPMKLMVDNSRNGASKLPNGWCNPDGQKLGSLPDKEFDPAADVEYVFIKTPGESDGNCGVSKVHAGDFDASLLKRQL